MSIRYNIVQRLLQITFHVIKHLGGYLLSGILRFLLPNAIIRQRNILLSDISRAKRLRLFLQDLSGIPIKIGQILAMRTDFLPDEYIEELLILLDEVPPFDPQVAKEIIEEELKSDISVLFKTFEEKPLAAASFGQVHTATLHNGDEVVVKVQRPEIPMIIANDLKLFRWGTFFIDATGLTKRTRLKPLFEDLAEWTMEEIDYRIEGSHVQQLYEKASGSQTERIPKVHWDLTSARILTLERLRGIWVKEIIQKLQTDRDAIIGELSELNTSLAKISQNLLQNSLRQIFEYGFYHADPHAANLLIMENGVIGYVDFGIIGQLDEKSKVLQVKVHIAIESGDFEQFYEAILDMVEPPLYANLALFKKLLRKSFITWTNAQYMKSTDIREKSFARFMLRLSIAAQRCWMEFSTMEVRIFRTLAIVDAAILQFSPNLNVRFEFRRFFAMYQTKKQLHDFPKFIHKLPMTIHTFSEELHKEVITVSSYVSKVRRFFARLFEVASILLIVAVVIASIKFDKARSLLHGLDIRPMHAVIGTLFAIVFFVWLSRQLYLRSIFQKPIIKTKQKNPKD